MKCCCEKLWKILAVVLLVSAAAFVVIKFWDKILDLLGQVKEKAHCLHAGSCECEE